MKQNKTFLILLFSLCFSFSYSQDFDIEFYHVEINVLEDAEFLVRETINVNFTAKKRGIYRDIPYRYNVNGDKISIKIEDIYVDDHKFNVSSKGNNKRIRIGDKDVFLSGAQKYTIEYRVKNAMIDEESWDEFYWNIIGTEWNAPIENASFEIKFPNTVTLNNNDIKIFSGRKGSQDNAVAHILDGSIIKGSSFIELDRYEGITIACRLPDGVVSAENAAKREESKPAPEDNSYPVPLSISAILLAWWWNRAKNSKTELNIVAQPLAPEEMSAAEVGTFYDNRANNRDILSLIPEWGEKGYIQVRALDTDKDMYLQKINDLPNSVPEYQWILFSELFAKSDLVKLSDLKNKMYQTLAKTKRSLSKYVKQKHLYDADAKRIFNSGLFLGLAGLFVVAGIVVMAKLSLVVTGFSCFMAAIVCFVIHFLPKRKSEQGLRLQEQILGLKEFLGKATDAEFQFQVDQDPRYFEKMLPFAVAFGLDKAITKRFNSLVSVAPVWYYYHDGYGEPSSRPSFSSYSENFNIKNVSSVFSSAPSSSGSSGGGFSGGSSGGGFGGGGGGSW